MFADTNTEHMNSLVKIFEEQIATQAYVVMILSEAARTERYLSKPRAPRQPLMYDLLPDLSYLKNEHGYYKPKMVLRASPRQIQRWEFAIECLLMIKEDVTEDPIFARQLVWLRANNYRWTELGKHFGYHRNTIKNKYIRILDRLCQKIKKETKLDDLSKILYLV